MVIGMYQLIVVNPKGAQSMVSIYIYMYIYNTKLMNDLQKLFNSLLFIYFLSLLICYGVYYYSVL